MQEAEYRIDLTEKEIKGFLKRMSKSTTCDCWNWIGRKKETGYGRYNFRGKTWRAHRFSFLIHHGEIPHGLHVLHSCDNPSCVNPKHLSLGTHQENIAQMDSRGRRYKRPRKQRVLKGRQRKLTSEKVSEIRRKYFGGLSTKADLAREFGVSNGSIYFVVNGLHWKHASMPENLLASSSPCVLLDGRKERRRAPCSQKPLPIPRQKGDFASREHRILE